MTRILLIGSLAASAGIHLALAAEHGPSFRLAAALLAGAAGLLALRPGRATAAAAGTLLAGLLAAYLVAGEGLDLVAGVTKAIEAAGLLFAARIVRTGAAMRPALLAGLAGLGVAAAIAVVAAAATPAHAHEHEHPQGHGSPTHRH